MSEKEIKDLQDQYRDLIKARREINYKIKLVRSQLRGAAAKESFRNLMIFLDLTEEEINEIEEMKYEK